MAPNNVKFYQRELGGNAITRRLMAAEPAGCMVPTNQGNPHKAQTIRNIEMVTKPRKPEPKEVG